MKQTLKDFLFPFLVIILILITLTSCDNKFETEIESSEEISDVEEIDSYELDNTNLYILVYNKKDTIFITESKYKPYSTAITIK